MTLFGLVTLSLTAHAVELRVVGECPGELAIEASGFTPGGTYALMSANAAGAFPIPAGTCAGTVSGLSADGAGVRLTGTADADGRIRLRPTVPEWACGLATQAIDLVDCDLSSVSIVGESLGGERVLFAADGRNGSSGTSLYKIDLDFGVISPVGDLGVPVTGMTYAPDGTLYGVTAQGCDAGEVRSIDPRTGDTVLAHTTTYGCWSGMSWDPVSRQLYAWTEVGDTLLAVDLGAGTEDAIYSASSYGHCMATDADGQLYRVAGGVVYAVDPIAGTEVELGIPDGLPAGARGQGCDFQDGVLYIAPSTDGLSRSLWGVDIASMSAWDTGIEMPLGLDALVAQP